MKLANLKARVSNFVKNNTKFVTGFMGTIALFTIVAISSVEISSSEFSAKANTLTNSSSESTVVTMTSISPKVTTTSATTTTVKTTTTTKVTTKKVVKKSVTEAALEVIKGKYGNGEERKKKLEKEGFKYDEVQDIVNKIMSGLEVPSIVVSDQESDSSYLEESINYYEDNDYSYSSESNDNSSSNSSIDGGTSYVKNFSRGTYYPAGYGAYGGSGRSLIDCSWGDGNVQGSIASSYLYNTYGYNYGSSGRTTVYLDVNDCPEMSGYYYVDDCDAGNPNVIDFFYNESSNCPFQYQGVLQDVDCYIVE